MRATLTFPIIWIGALYTPGLMSSANANPINIFNTGVNNSGFALAAGDIDPHYVLVSTSAGFSPTFVVNPGGPVSPSGPWVANSSASQWIAPAADQTSYSTLGEYDYRITFDLAGLNPNTAVLDGLWSSDNEGVIDLNGSATANIIGSTTYSSLTPFSVTGGFVPGINTIDFVVTNDVCPACFAGNPTGLNVDFTQATASPVSSIPEPLALALLGVGLAGLGWVRRPPSLQETAPNPS